MEKVRTSIDVERQLWKDFQKLCIDLDLSNTKGLEVALTQWISANSAGSQASSDAENPPARRSGSHAQAGGVVSAADIEKRTGKLVEESAELERRAKEAGTHKARSRKAGKGALGNRKGPAKEAS